MTQIINIVPILKSMACAVLAISLAVVQPVQSFAQAAGDGTPVQNQMDYNRIACQNNGGTWTGSSCDYRKNESTNDSSDSSCGWGCALLGAAILGIGAVILSESNKDKNRSKSTESSR